LTERFRGKGWRGVFGLKRSVRARVQLTASRLHYLVVAQFRDWRTASWSCRNGAAVNASADTLRAAVVMKALAAFVLALSLFLRAAPICAKPVQADATAMMPDCEQGPKHHGDKPGRKGSDTGRTCHACVYPPEAKSALKQPLMIFAVPVSPAAKQLTGAALKPPTPPPRVAPTRDFDNSMGV
jgi:hypothetical protein